MKYQKWVWSADQGRSAESGLSPWMKAVLATRTHGCPPEGTPSDDPFYTKGNLGGPGNEVANRGENVGRAAIPYVAPNEQGGTVPGAGLD